MSGFFLCSRVIWSFPWVCYFIVNINPRNALELVRKEKDLN